MSRYDDDYDYPEYDKWDAMRDEYRERKDADISKILKATTKWIEKHIEEFSDWGYLAHVDHTDKEWEIIWNAIDEEWDDWDEDYQLGMNTKEIFEMWARLLIAEGIYPMDEDGVRAEKAPPIPQV